MNDPSTEIVDQYAMLLKTGKERSAEFLLDVVACYRVAAEIPPLITTLLENFGRVAADRVIGTVAGRSTPKDFAAVIEALPAPLFGTRRYYKSLLSIAASRPQKEIEAIVEALNEVSLYREALQLIKCFNGPLDLP